MNETSHQPDLMTLAHLARRSVGLIARSLFDYQASLHLTDDQLAFIVGVEVSQLPHLALCRWPHSEEDVLAIAQYTAADIEKLMAWLREQKR